MNAALREAWAGLPGGAVATVIVPGRGRWTGAVGYANVERKRAMTADRQSNIGSVTKTFTGMLVLQEVAAGRLDLQDRLDRWYPEIPKAGEITIAMLLNMSSGIGDYLNANVLGFAKQLMQDPKKRYRPDDLIDQGAALPREFDVPGSGFAYSNTNTVILARILERETGRSYAALLRSQRFTPLGLPRSFLDVSGDLQPPHAQTYSDVFSIDPSVPPVGRTTDWSQSVTWAAGGLWSTRRPWSSTVVRARQPTRLMRNSPAVGLTTSIRSRKESTTSRLVYSPARIPAARSRAERVHRG